VLILSIRRPHSKSRKKGPKHISAVFGTACDALDTISQAEALPELKLGDLVYSENIGACSHASSTHFNGFPPAQVIHIHQQMIPDS
jgi:ornithine decarboxylase